MGYLGDIKSNGVDKKIVDGEIPVNLLNYMDVYNRKKITKDNCVSLMRVTAKTNQIVDNNVLQNDVYITPSSETSDDIGRVMVIEETLPNTVYSYHLVRFRPHEGVFYSVFPNYVLESDYIRTQMRLSAQGVQRFVLNKDAIENLLIYLPIMEEQTQIGLFFRYLDHLITLHQRKPK